MSKLKPGYKETEVGAIPDDWEVKELAEGLTLTSSKRIFEKDYVPSGIPFYRGKEISQLRKSINIDDLLFIGYEKYLDIKNRFGVPKEGDLLITSVGTLGNVYLVKNNSPFYFKDGNLIWIKDIKNSVPLYLLFLLEKNRNRVIDTAIGSSQKALTIVSLGKLRLPLPPTLAEQEKIATALSDTDSYIEKLEKLIEKKKYIKTGAMQELLTGNKRLPGFGKGKGYKETPVGVIPEDWEVKKLGEVAFIKMGQSPLSIYYNNSNIGLPLVQGNADLKNRKTIIRHYTSYITKKGSLGDVIMSVRAPVGEIAICVFDCCLGRGVCAISYPNKYLYHYMVNQENNWSKYSSGSTFDSVNSDVVYNFPFGLPPTLAEQEKIATVLSDMDSEIEKLEVKLDKYKNIKQGMMQKLLTGEIRLV